MVDPDQQMITFLKFTILTHDLIDLIYVQCGSKSSIELQCGSESSIELQCVSGSK